MLSRSLIKWRYGLRLDGQNSPGLRVWTEKMAKQVIDERMGTLKLLVWGSVQELSESSC